MTYAGPRIDCDVHNVWAHPADLIAYLPARWRAYMNRYGHGLRAVNPPGMSNPVPHGGHTRVDASPPGGGPAGSDYETLREQLLDRFNVARAVLAFDIGQTPALANVELASAMCRAANDWQIEHWLSHADDRLHGAIVVPTQLPLEAAEEIRRVGSHPRVCEVLIVASGVGKPFGDPIYHPIYEATAELGLSLGLHIGDGLFLPGAASQVAAGGIPSTRFEKHDLHMLPAHHHLLSFIVHGVFEKFPGLDLLIKETGTLAYFPWLLTEMDAAYGILRRESTWVRRRPSDYFRSNVWLTTQPLDESPRPSQLIQLLETTEGFADRLCFASDYPHHDTDDPTSVDRRLPQSWWRRVCFENPVRAFKWQSDERLLAAGAASEERAGAR